MLLVCTGVLTGTFHNMRLAACSLEALERSSQPCFGAQPWERTPLTITVGSVGFNFDKRWRFNPWRKSMASKRFYVTAGGYPKFENWCTREDRDTVYFYTHIFPPCRDVAHPTARFWGPPGWCMHIFFLTWDALPRVFWVLLGRSAEASK